MKQPKRRLTRGKTNQDLLQADESPATTGSFDSGIFINFAVRLIDEPGCLLFRQDG